MEAICYSETSFDYQGTTRRYVPEDSTLHNHRCENLKYYNNRINSRFLALERLYVNHVFASEQLR
jgi:hypothetical protein